MARWLESSWEWRVAAASVAVYAEGADVPLAVAEAAGAVLKVLNDAGVKQWRDK